MTSRFHIIGILVVHVPFARVVGDVFAYSGQIGLVAYYVFVVIALSYAGAGRVTRLVYAFGRIHFNVTDDFGNQHGAPVFRIVA
jgi:hypothetical protein